MGYKKIVWSSLAAGFQVQLEEGGWGESSELTLLDMRGRDITFETLNRLLRQGYEWRSQISKLVIAAAPEDRKVDWIMWGLLEGWISPEDLRGLVL